jgi:hypothetical protein
MHSFSMRPAKYVYDKPLPKYLDPKAVLIYRPHPVYWNVPYIPYGTVRRRQVTTCINLTILHGSLQPLAAVPGVQSFDAKPQIVDGGKLSLFIKTKQYSVQRYQKVLNN